MQNPPAARHQGEAAGRANKYQEITTMTRTWIESIRTSTLALLSVVALTAAVEPAAAQMYMNSPERIEFTVDVAEDMDLYREPRVPIGAEPLRGSFFITEGKIYPAGTIPSVNGAAFNPKTAAGAIGTWFCKGTFLVSGSVFDQSPMAVLSDQLYLLATDKQSIATTGTEGNGVTVRPVVGGTGQFAGYTGEQTQEFLGFNATGGVNLRVTMRLRKTTSYR
jgi:hypothetical protein